MTESTIFLQGPHDAPLSTAFRQAWQDWQVLWDSLEKGVDGDQKLAQHAAEAAMQVTRRLSRCALASTGKASAQQIQHLEYAFVALLDETLLFSPWAGQKAWQEKPLEACLYGSRNAGERVPLAIRSILDKRTPTSRDLANVYLQCLILGFYGRLRTKGGAAIHEKWRHALFTFVWLREPSYIDVAQTLERPSLTTPTRLPVSRSLPDGWRLAVAILCGVTLLTLLGHVFWRDIYQELSPVLYLPAAVPMEQRP